MAVALFHTLLTHRALIAVEGEDWRGFLQGLITQDVERLEPGEIRFGALLSPQGRLLFDLFVVGREAGAWLDVEADRREALIARLSLYRLRAKVTLAPDTTPVAALFGPGATEAPGWLPDPRLPALGLRGYGAPPPPEAMPSSEKDYDRRRLVLGVPTAADFGDDRTYPIEANFDLLHGIDFQKGCFVGQETTSRMKRRGQIKTRMLPIAFDGPAPDGGAEILAGDLRAGQVLSGAAGLALASLRLDRIGGPLTVEGRPVRVEPPAWMPELEA